MSTPDPSTQGKLQAIVGSQPGMMRLQLLDQAGTVVAALGDDTRMLGYYPVYDYMTLHVRARAAACGRNERRANRC